jgi:hypothetical protein
MKTMLIRRLGLFGFVFFFLKGMAWLVLAAAATLGVAQV